MKVNLSVTRLVTLVKLYLKQMYKKRGAVLARDGLGWNNWGMVGVRELKSSSPLKAFDIPTSVSKSNEMNRRVYSENGRDLQSLLTHHQRLLKINSRERLLKTQGMNNNLSYLTKIS